MSRPRRWLTFRVDNVLDSKVRMLCRETGLTASEVGRLAQLPSDVRPLISLGLGAARLRSRTGAEGPRVGVSDVQHADS